MKSLLRFSSRSFVSTRGSVRDSILSKNSHRTTTLLYTRFDSTFRSGITGNLAEINSLSHPYLPLNGDVSVPELLDRLNTGTKNLNLDKIWIDEGLSLCTEKLPQFSDEELVELLSLLKKLRPKIRPRFRNNILVRSLLCKLNEECCIRFKKNSLGSVLPIMEEFSHMGRPSNFIYRIFVREVSAIHNKPIDVVLQFVKIMNRQNVWKSQYAKPYEIEYFMENNFDQLSYKEIIPLLEALILMKRPLMHSYELKKKLLLFIIDQALIMDERRVYTFLDCLCRLHKFTTNMKSLTPEFAHFVDRIDEKFDEFSFDNISCVSFLTTGFLLNKPEFLRKVYDRFLKEALTVKISSVDRVIRSLTFFNFHSTNENVYSNILEILRNESFRSQTLLTKRYVKLLSWICNAGVYDYDLINEILDEKFLLKVYGNLSAFAIYPHPYVIDTSLQIECPNYTGNRLNKKSRQDITNKCYDWELIPLKHPKLCYTTYYQFADHPELNYNQKIQDLPYYKILQEAGSTFNSIFGGDEFTHLCYILPHMPRPNLIFALDSNKNPRDISRFKDMQRIDCTLLLDSSTEWKVITVWIRNTSLNGEAVPLGEEITKIRQFKKLGFSVSSIVQDEWLNMDDARKRDFCINIIS